MYEDEAFEDAFRLDLLVDGEVVVELKSTGAMNPVLPSKCGHILFSQDWK